MNAATKPIIAGSLGAVALCAPVVANATYFNATFDCGGGTTVWIGNPVVGHGEDRKRIVIFEIRTSEFDSEATPVMPSPVVQWDVHKDEVIGA
jgi:hypothetical protein